MKQANRLRAGIKVAPEPARSKGEDSMLHVTDTDLARTNEGMLLRMVMMEWDLDHHDTPAAKTFPGALDCSPQFLNNCINDNGHIGIDRWIKLANFTQTTLWTRWLALRLRG